MLRISRFGCRNLYSMPAGGGRPRLLVRYDDPEKQVFIYGLTVGDGKLYFSIGEFESDIYVMDLEMN